MSDDWTEGYEPSGISLGPEERLEREIAKSKALKVERLQLRDRISHLEEEVESISRENTELTRKLAETKSGAASPQTGKTPEAPSSMEDPNCGNCWVRGGVAIGLIATAILLARWYLN